MMKQQGTFFSLMAMALVLVLAATGSGCGEKQKRKEAEKELRKKQLARMRRSLAPTASDFEPSAEVIPIKNPKPTHFERDAPYTELELIGEITGNINNDNFMVQPWNITGDELGNIYAMDIRLKRIFKFTKTGSYITSFGEAGIGPGMLGSERVQNEIFYDRNCRQLFVSDPFLQRLTAFSPDGKFLRDYKINLRGGDGIDFFPLVSPSGEVFIRTGSESTLDAYKIDGNTLEFQYHLLGPDFFTQSVHHHIRKFDESDFYHISSLNTSYCLSPKGKLFVYLHHMSELLTIQGEKIEKRCYLWPEIILNAYLKYGGLRNVADTTIFSPVIFEFSCFDNDNGEDLYLWQRPPKLAENDKTKALVYKYNPEGKLVEVFHSDTGFYLRCINGGLIYGVRTDSIAIFRPKI